MELSIQYQIVIITFISHLVVLCSGSDSWNNPYEDEMAKSRVKRQLDGSGTAACMQIYTVPKRQVVCEPSQEVRNSLKEIDSKLSGYQNQLDGLGVKLDNIDPNKPRELTEEVKERLNTIDSVEVKQASNTELIQQLGRDINGLLTRVESVESTERIEMARLIEQQSALIRAALHQSNATLHHTYLDTLANTTTNLANRIAEVETGLLNRLHDTEDGMEERVHVSGNISMAIIDMLRDRFDDSLQMLKERIQAEADKRADEYEETADNSATLLLMETQLTNMREHQARYESHEAELRQEIELLQGKLAVEKEERDAIKLKTANLADGMDQLRSGISDLRKSLQDCANESDSTKDVLRRLVEHVKRKEHILPKSIKGRLILKAILFLLLIYLNSAVVIQFLLYLQVELMLSVRIEFHRYIPC